MRLIERMNLRQLMLILLLFLLATTVFAQEFKPLATEKAFAFSASVPAYREPGRSIVIAQWNIAPGYFLYRKHFRFNVNDPNAKVTAQFPKPLTKTGLDDTPEEFYAGVLKIPVIIETNQPKVTLEIKYQGCSERGFCYPPMQKRVIAYVAAVTTSNQQSPNNFSAITERTGFTGLLNDQDGVKNLLKSQNFAVVLLFFLGLGLLLAFTPCVLPMIPILTGIIVGQKKDITQTKVFLLSLTYVLGASITYAAAGVLAAAMGSSLQIWLQTPQIIAFISALFALLAISLFGFYDLSLPSGWQNKITAWSNRQRSGSYIGVFLMGTLSSLVVSPCVTAPLVGVLIYIADSGNIIFGASALFVMGLGMGLPLLLIGMSAGRWLPKRGPWMEAVKKFFGFVMLGMAIWLLSRIMSSRVELLAWSLLFLSLAVFFWIYLPKLIGKHHLNRGIGVLIGIFGIVLVLGSIGFTNPLMKWMPINFEPVNFTMVRTVDDVKKRLATAQAEHKPVILDFYADWCESCIAMDRYVFSQPKIRNKMSHFILLRADLTQITAADEALLKKFNVVAPPTVIFFDPHGQELDSNRIVGGVNAKEFSLRLDGWLKMSRDQHSGSAGS